MHFKPRLDANQKEIVKKLRANGWFVQSLASLGGGVPDLLIARDGEIFLLEVKDGKKCASQKKLTDAEKRWINSILSVGNVRVFVVEKYEDIEDENRNIKLFLLDN